MLILTRRVGETLIIGDDVSVTVLGVKGNQVRLGVNAPKDVSVHREEIYQRILKEKKSLNGTISIGSYTSDLDEIETKKNKLTGVVIVEGERVQLELNFDKNSFEGIAQSSQGNIPMTGKRKSE